jgi:hypothetical protein
VGTPIETWEPARNIKGTQVWLNWLANETDADAATDAEDLDGETPTDEEDEPGVGADGALEKA